MSDGVAVDDGHGRYSRDPDVALLQLEADEVRERCEVEGADYDEVKCFGADRPIAVRRRR